MFDFDEIKATHLGIIIITRRLMHFVRVTFAEVQSQRRKRNDAAYRSFTVRPSKNHKTLVEKIQRQRQCRWKSETFWFGC